MGKYAFTERSAWYTADSHPAVTLGIFQVSKHPPNSPLSNVGIIILVQMRTLTEVKGLAQGHEVNDLLEEFKNGIESVLGEGSCYVLSIRPQGGVEMEVE